jgi:hypothetical protein
VGKDGQFDYSYNAQISVDEDNQIAEFNEEEQHMEY